MLLIIRNFTVSPFLWRILIVSSLFLSSALPRATISFRLTPLALPSTTRRRHYRREIPESHCTQKCSKSRRCASMLLSLPLGSPSATIPACLTTTGSLTTLASNPQSHHEAKSLTLESTSKQLPDPSSPPSWRLHPIPPSVSHLSVEAWSEDVPFEGVLSRGSTRWEEKCRRIAAFFFRGVWVY